MFLLLSRRIWRVKCILRFLRTSHPLQYVERVQRVSFSSSRSVGRGLGPGSERSTRVDLPFYHLSSYQRSTLTTPLLRQLIPDNELGAYNPYINIISLLYKFTINWRYCGFYHRFSHNQFLQDSYFNFNPQFNPFSFSTHRSLRQTVPSSKSQSRPRTLRVQCRFFRRDNETFSDVGWTGDESSVSTRWRLTTQWRPTVRGFFIMVLVCRKTLVTGKGYVGLIKP